MADKPSARRPKGRAELILTAATKLFSERGHDAVSLDEIGEAVGITGPAIYRHFDSKEALLVAVVERALDRYGARYQEVSLHAQTPEEQLRALADCTIGPTIDDLGFLSLVMTDVRLLPSALMRRARLKRDAAMQLWIAPLLALHPGLSKREAIFLVEAGTCLSPSLLAYQPNISRGKVISTLTAMLVAAYLAPLPATEDDHTSDDRDLRAWVDRPLRASARERVLEVAAPLFRERGFSRVGIDDIGAAAGVTGPAIYRHFRNKQEILLAILSRVNEQLAVNAGHALGRSRDQFEALDRLIDGYIDLAFDDSDFMVVYWAQKQSLSEEVRATIAVGERSYIGDWNSVLRQLRPELSEGVARTMTYAALGMMNTFWYGSVTIPDRRARTLLSSMVRAALLDS